MVWALRVPQRGPQAEGWARAWLDARGDVYGMAWCGQWCGQDRSGHVPACQSKTTLMWFEPTQALALLRGQQYAIFSATWK